ncbi:hypothetical protein D3C77_211390 [compost metagenome]
MPLMTWRVMLKTLSILTRITSDHWSAVILWKKPSRVMPALFTSTSMGPSCASTSRTARSQSSNEPTLPFTTMTPSSRAVACAASSLPE